jgi:RNA polymerase sigma factor (TIGR02999 family)
MRRILVDEARRRRSHKRGGGAAHLTLNNVQLAAREPPPDLLALNEALEKLASEDSVAAELVKLRYFGGLTLPEVADVLTLSPRTADRLWAYARAWLRREIAGT